MGGARRPAGPAFYLDVERAAGQPFRDGYDIDKPRVSLNTEDAFEGVIAITGRKQIERDLCPS